MLTSVVFLFVNLFCIIQLNTSNYVTAMVPEENPLFIIQHPREPVYYTEGWKKGSHQIQEQKLQIILSKQNTYYESIIKDASGQISYRLLIKPVIVNNRDTIITAWSIELIEPDNNYSLLQPHNSPKQHEFSKEDFLATLYPVVIEDIKKTGYGGVPLSAKRVIKVEGFYCVIQVKSYKLQKGVDTPALESIEIQIEFANTYKAT